MGHDLDARFSLVTAPAEEPLTVQDVVDQCQLGEIHDDQRRLVAAYITGARQTLERRLRRQFVTATWKLYLDSLPGEILITDKLPVKTISHIKYYNASGTLTTMTPAATYYQADLVSEGRPARIIPAYGTTWPSVRADTLNAVEIQFTCGYGAASAVPAAIKNGMLLLIANAYENREDIVIGTISSRIANFLEQTISPEDWGAYS
jgi:uncharacterized phiE125 gp8 family phage protein